MSVFVREMVLSWRADVDIMPIEGVVFAVQRGTSGSVPACRCWRCGVLLSAEMVWVSPALQRPACRSCAS